MSNTKTKFRLTIISHHEQLPSVEAESLTAPTTLGEITILPGHIPLFAKLELGMLRYLIDGAEHLFVVGGGFVDVSPDNEVVVMVDQLENARDISLQKAEAAVQAAKQTQAQTRDQRELMLAEAALRRALLEVKVAERSKRRQI